MLIIFSGLPGTGKTTIARELAKRLRAVYLRIDTLERAIQVWMPDFPLTREGYEIAYALASENLSLGMTVIADSVNPFQLTRDDWVRAATSQGRSFLEVEVCCSDPVEHRKRVEFRESDIAGFKPPTWQEVLNRRYDPWTREHLAIDTAIMDVADAVLLLERAVANHPSGQRHAPSKSLPS